MTEYVEITIPSLYSDGSEIPAPVVDAATDTVAVSFTDVFGGATITEGRGYYRHSDGRLAVEDVRIVKAYSFDPVDVDSVRNTAQYLAWFLSQEAILLNVSGSVEFIGEEA